MSSYLLRVYDVRVMVRPSVIVAMMQWGMVALVLRGVWLWVGRNDGYVGTRPGQWGDGMGVVAIGNVNVFLLLFAIE